MIALEPEIILLDEATSALDPISTYKTEDLMQEMKEIYSDMMNEDTAGLMYIGFEPYGSELRIFY